MTVATATKASDAPKRPAVWLGLAAAMAAIAVTGFWPSYWGPLFSGTLDMHWLLHLHGIVLTSWVILLVIQAGLVRHGRLARHRQLGTRVGIVWGLLVFTIGLAAVFGTISPEAGVEYEKLEDFIRAMMFSIPNIMGFGLLFGAALYLRNRPAAHKRLMVFATFLSPRQGDDPGASLPGYPDAAGGVREPR